MKAIKYILFCALLLGSFFKTKAQDTLKFDKFKDIGIYATSEFDQRYANLNFLKCRLISPVASVFDSQKGNSNDSILSAIKYLGLVNDLDLANKNDDQKINLNYIENKLIQHIRQNSTPISLTFIDYFTFKDSTIALGYVEFNNNKFINNCPTNYFPFKKDTLFAASVLNEVFDQNQINFLFSDSLILANIPTDSIKNIMVDFDNGIGFQNIEKNQIVSINYPTSGNKIIKVKILVNGKTFISKSKITINPQISTFAISNCSTPIKPPNTITNISTTKLGTFVSGKYGVWYSTCNNQNKIRKPFIISAGYNPGNGKQLTEGLINVQYVSFDLAGGLYGLILGPQIIQVPIDVDWNGEFRGTFYETYNGAYNKRFSPTEFSQCGGADNANRFLDRLRDEGYDVIILSYDKGKDFVKNNAALFMELIEEINVIKVANGFNFENVVCGYSSGGIASRLALALMESRYKQGLGPHHHSKAWISFEGEQQGANVPLGFQHLLRFQKDPFYTIPTANTFNLGADIVNQLIAKIAYDAVDSDNAFELIAYNAAVAGNGPDVKRINLLNEFASVPLNNSNGYPEFLRRIAVSQGSGIGINVPHSSPNMFDTYLGRDFSASASSLGSSCGGSYTWVAPKCVKTTTARWWSGNQNVFDGAVNLDASFTFFPLTCINLPVFGCKCLGPYTTNIPIQLKQTHIAPPNYLTTNYDDAPASTGPSHIELYSLSAYPFYNNFISGQGYANFDPKFHGFTPITSALDLHNPTNGSPASNFSRVDNAPTGLNLLNINNSGNVLNQQPDKRFGFPYLAYPSNHYQITPFDAVFVIGTNNGTDVNNNPRPDNQYHNEDPQEFIGNYLARDEVAPTQLFLSNQTIGITASAFGGYAGGYKAEFEARDKIIVGKTDASGLNNIYSLYGNLNYLTPNGDLKVAIGSKAILHSGNLVEFLPGFEVPVGAELDAFIQSYNCADLLFRVNNNSPTNNAQNEPKHNLPNLGFNYDEPLNKKSNTKINSFLLYPNPNNGSFTYVNVCDEQTSTLIISDLSGKTVYNGTIYNNSPLDLNLSVLNNGLYLVKVINKNSADNFKLTINK